MIQWFSLYEDLLTVTSVLTLFDSISFFSSVIRLVFLANLLIFCWSSNVTTTSSTAWKQDNVIRHCCKKRAHNNWWDHRGVSCYSAFKKTETLCHDSSVFMGSLLLCERSSCVSSTLSSDHELTRGGRSRLKMCWNDKLCLLCSALLLSSAHRPNAAQKAFRREQNVFTTHTTYYSFLHSGGSHLVFFGCCQTSGGAP